MDLRIEGSEKPPDQPWFIPNDEEQGVYRFFTAAARRARQLQAGACPTISTTSRKPTKIAMEEIRTGEISVDLDPQLPEPVSSRNSTKLSKKPRNSTPALPPNFESEAEQCVSALRPD